MDHADHTTTPGQANVVPAILRGYAERIAAHTLTLDGASILSVWLCIALARAAPRVLSEDVSQQFVSLVTLPLIIVIPRQIGTLLAWLVKPLGLSWPDRDDVVDYVLAWVAGVCALILTLTVVVGQFQLDSVVAAFAVLLLITAAGMRPLLSTGNEGKHELRLAVDWPAAAWLLAALLLTAVPLVMVRSAQPYPVQTGWGIFNYSYHLLRFEEWNQIALKPGLHTPVQPAVAGIAGLATGASAEGLLWAIPVLQFVAFGAGTYYLAKRLTGNNLLALAALWITVWILSLQIFRHLHGANLRGALLALSPWITLVLLTRMPLMPRDARHVASRLVLPAGLIASAGIIRWLLPAALQPWLLVALVAAALFVLRRLPDTARADAAVLGVAGGSLAFMHLFEGPIFFAAALALAVLIGWQPVSAQWRLGIGAVYAVTVALILLQVVGWLSFSDPSMISRLALGEGRADAIEIPFAAKLELLRRGLPFLIMGLLGWSALRTLFRPHAQQLALLLCISLAMSAYFLPESGLHRVVGTTAVLIGIAVAFELRWIAATISMFAPPRHQRVFASLFIVAALIAMTPTLTYSVRFEVGLDSKFGFPLPGREGTFTGSTLGEYDAASWIRENTPSDWAIVSDPTTMFIMQGLTLRPQVAEKRAWVAESEYTVGDQERLATLDEQVFLAPTDEEVLAGLRSVTRRHDGAMIVFSYRTLDWLLHDDPFRLKQPQQNIPLYTGIVESICENNQLEPCPSRLFASDNFREVYHYNGVAILIPASQVPEFEAQLD